MRSKELLVQLGDDGGVGMLHEVTKHDLVLVVFCQLVNLLHHVDESLEVHLGYWLLLHECSVRTAGDGPITLSDLLVQTCKELPVSLSDLVVFVRPVKRQ